jgi:hypothetical protein
LLTRDHSGARTYRGTTAGAVKRNVKRRPAPNRTILGTFVEAAGTEKFCPLAFSLRCCVPGNPAFAEILELSIGIVLPFHVIEVALKRRCAGAPLLADRFKAVTVPEIGVPARKIGFPCTTIASSSSASNESPTCALALEIEDFRRMVNGVPAGTSAVGGSSEELGDIPSSRLC